MSRQCQPPPRLAGGGGMSGGSRKIPDDPLDAITVAGQHEDPPREGGLVMTSRLGRTNHHHHGRRWHRERLPPARSGHHPQASASSRSWTPSRHCSTMASSSPSAYRTTRSTQSRSTSTGHFIYEAVFGVDFEMSRRGGARDARSPERRVRVRDRTRSRHCHRVGHGGAIEHGPMPGA